MAGWLVATRTEVETWLADSGAPGRLPELVRRLILETNRTVEHIDFPGDTGTRSPSFDGFAIAREPSLNVPEGRSVWELSVETGANRKAEEDYELRFNAAVPDGTPASSITYIAVSPQVWIKGPSFAKERSAAGHWKEVRAIRLDQLVTWLEQAPATRLWFLEHIGKAPLGVELLDTWFTRWCAQTTPAFTSELLLAGRDASSKAIAATLMTPGMTTVVGRVGAAELRAVIAASFATHAREAAERIVVIDNHDSWRRMLQESQPMVLITTDPTYAEHVDVDTVHVVLVAVPHQRTGGIEVEQLSGDEFEMLLRKLNDRVPRDLGALAGRSLVAVRRRLGNAAELMNPPWAGGVPTRPMRAALMACEWDDKNEHDRAIVAALAGTSYESVREELLHLTAGHDPFVGRADSHWFVVSPQDSWPRLGAHLMDDDLKAFLGHARGVLSELDPTAGAGATDRLVAQIRGDVRRYSQAIRDGLSTSLALLGANGEIVAPATGHSGEVLAARVVRELLDLANADPSGAHWATIAPLLPSLIEAVPTTVLGGLRDGSTDPDPVLRTAFRDKSDDLFAASSPHHNLQWALERAAWATEHLTDACLQLARLVELDPGGRYSHRPDGSLASILSVWHPGTAAPADERFATIDLIRRQFPGVGWKLLIDLLPTDRGILMGTNTPQFRAWKTHREITHADVYEQTAELVTRLLADVGTEASRWAELIEVHTHLGPTERAAVRDAVAALDLPDTDHGATTRAVVYDALRSTAAHHHQFPDAPWALPANELADLDALIDSFTPTRRADKHAWLFQDHWVELDDVAAEDWRAQDAQVAQRRAAAITEIEAAGRLEAVIAFARKVNAQVVGPALADATGDRYLDWAICVSVDEPDAPLARQLVWRRARQGGLAWVEATIDSHDPNPDTQGRMLVDCNEYPAAAQAAARRGDAVEHAYWTGFPTFGLGPDFPDAVEVARRLMNVGRAADALDLLYLYARTSQDDPDHAIAVAEGLELLREQAAQDQVSRLGRGHAFPTFFALFDRYVAAVGEQRVIKLEWLYFGMLGIDPPDTYLHRRFATDVAWFMEVLTLGFSTDTEIDRFRAGEEPEDSDGRKNEDREERADGQVRFQARRLLETWRSPPGLSDDGFSVADCKAWVTAVTPLAEEADRVRVAMEMLGEAIVHAAPEDDWPTPEVAELVEALASDHIEAGMNRRLRNQRGASSRRLTEGGAPERMLSERYRERRDTVRRVSPRLARMFDELAQSYDSEARWHDQSAERRRQGLWD